MAFEDIGGASREVSEQTNLFDKLGDRDSNPDTQLQRLLSCR